MSHLSNMHTVSLMPAAAARAALETFASITRERHPGVVLVPLERVGTDRAVIAATTGQIVRPFASPEDCDAVLDWRLCGGALDDHRVD